MVLILRWSFRLWIFKGGFEIGTICSCEFCQNKSSRWLKKEAGLDQELQMALVGCQPGPLNMAQGKKQAS